MTAHETKDTRGIQVIAQNDNLIYVPLVALIALQFLDVLVCLVFGFAALFLNDFA
jgi:hypothetical protein